MKVTRIQNQRKTRKRSVEIRTIPEDAPWMMVSAASSRSGVTEAEIREKFFLRKFGNADYVAPSALNRWILTATIPEGMASVKNRKGFQQQTDLEDR